MTEIFRRFAQWASGVTGSAGVFLVASSVVLIWALSGPFFAFSDTWQLVINTSTTVITFLMVFLIQNTQNRDTRAIHAKLDELIVHEEKARNELVLAEDLSDQELDDLKAQFRRWATGEWINQVQTASEINRRCQARHQLGTRHPRARNPLRR